MGFEKVLGAAKVIKDQIPYRSQKIFSKDVQILSSPYQYFLQPKKKAVQLWYTVVWSLIHLQWYLY